MMKNPLDLMSDSRAPMKYYHIVAVFFVLSFVYSKILTVKIIAIGPLVFGAGMLLFPLSYVFSDILTEVYGYQRARQLIWLAILANLVMAMISQGAVSLPAAPFWHHSQGYDFVLGNQPRFFIASVIGYFCGDFINCYIIARLKNYYQNRYIWLRFISSTAIGVSIDSTIFVLIAFSALAPFVDVMRMAVIEYLMKVCYEIIMSPLSVALSVWLKKAEKIDVYDNHTNFSPFKFSVDYRDRDNRYID